MFKQTSRPVESFIVAKTSTTLLASGSLHNTTTGNVNLADGQIGFAGTSFFGSTAAYTMLPTSMTIDTAPRIAIFQGNANSAGVAAAQAAATYPLSAPSYEKSGDIDGTKKVLVTKQAYRDPQHSLWNIGHITASNVAAINVLNSTEYALTIALRGRRQEESFGFQQVPSVTYSVTTPDFSATPSITDPIDYIVHNLAWQINRSSSAVSIPGRYAGQDPILALAVGTASGTAISGIAVGDNLQVVSTSLGIRTVPVTHALLDTLTAASTATSFTHVHVVDTSTAGTATGGVSLGLWIIGLDSKKAYVDYIPQVKTRVDVSLTRGFTYLTVASSQVSKPDEGQGQGTVLDLWYKATQGQRKYNLRHVEDPTPNYPSPFDTAGKYVVYNISHASDRQIGFADSVQSPYLEVLCIPSTETTLITNVETALNTWLASGDNQAIVTL